MNPPVTCDHRLQDMHALKTHDARNMFSTLDVWLLQAELELWESYLSEDSFIAGPDFTLAGGTGDSSHALFARQLIDA